MQKIRILAVDDNEINRLLVQHCLVDEPDYEVAVCSSGAEALALLNRDEKFDLLLLDWNMPEMSGYDLLRTLRSDHRFDDIQIMMLTAKSEMQDVLQALDAGAGEYLMKPFNREMLLNKICLLLLS
jgi:CheY-like chemotaxis protein